MILAIICTTILLTLLIIQINLTNKYKTRLKNKDILIAKMIEAIPILIVDDSDNDVGFYYKVRIEYDSKFISIKWAYNGKNMLKYNNLMFKYFYNLEQLGISIHPIILDKMPYKGRIMNESIYNMDEDELDITI